MEDAGVVVALYGSFVSPVQWLFSVKDAAVQWKSTQRQTLSVQYS